MKKKITSSLSGEPLTAPLEEYQEEDTRSLAGSPRLSTLRMLRQFARVYHFDRQSSVPSGLILN